ncbi:MAG: gluconate 2-dehydrogenase subunit 3 family protein [Bryobacteraceae bacterium]
MATRRKALITLTAGSAAMALANGGTQESSAHHMHETAAEDHVRNEQRTPQFFQERDYATIVRLSDLIIPRTETPGAADVGVPWRIDQTVFRKPELRPLYVDGLAYLNKSAQKRGRPDFLSLAEDNQVAILKKISDQSGTREGEFFESLKSLTIEWYYNSEPGLAEELGFKGNTYRTEFIGCTHPEHWPVQKG